MKFQLIAVLLSLTLPVFSHEGHDHDAPQTVNAPNGGIVKSLEETYVEAVSKGNQVFIYLYDKEMKPKNVSLFELSATAQFPKNKIKEKPVAFVKKDFHFDATFDAQGSHRYTLKIQIKDPATGHKDKMSFVIEPQKGS
jgi:hypothetical protein